MRLSGMVLLSVTLLAGCGVDGEPIRPSMTTSIGVGSGGVSAGTTMSATSGNTSISVGVGL